MHIGIDTYNVTNNTNNNNNNDIKSLSAYTEFSLHKQGSSPSHIPYC